MRFLSRAIGALLPFIVLYPVAAAELTHHDIEAGFDPVERELTVTDRITARGETVTLRIAPWLSIERADAGGARIAPLRARRELTCPATPAGLRIRERTGSLTRCG